MAKQKKNWECSNCGYQSARWEGQCSRCKEWNTLIEKQIVTTVRKSGLISKSSGPKVLQDIKELDLSRVSTGFVEFDRVLGIESDGDSGIVKGSVVLISGDPGIGKSTVLAQIFANLAIKNKTLYVSAEESIDQIGVRVNRIKSKNNGFEKILFANAYYIDEIIEYIDETEAKFVVIDSIQTISDNDTSGIAGGLAQVRAVASKLVNYAKSNGVTLFMVGHINKEGSIAGPKILEHLVDTVIQIEGDKDTDLRIIRSIKNRYGATNEVGLMNMEEYGLVDVSNPAEYFLSKDKSPGVCRSIIFEGNRPLIVEVQALTTTTIYSLPKRVAEGISVTRLQLVCAILQKHLRLNLSDKDVYLNISGGINVKDRSLDLAIAMAIYSSIKSKIIPSEMVSFGEISLSGSINKSTNHSFRKKEAKRLDFSTVTQSSKYSNIRDIQKIF